MWYNWHSIFTLLNKIKFKVHQSRKVLIFIKEEEKKIGRFVNFIPHFFHFRNIIILFLTCIFAITFKMRSIIFSSIYEPVHMSQII
jgi:hypothetical protein